MAESVLEKVVDANCRTQADYANSQMEHSASVPVIRVSPSEPLPIENSLIFKPSEMKKAFKLGAKDARKISLPY